MFLEATLQYSPIKNQFYSFDTDKQSTSKSPKVHFFNAKLTPNLPSNTREIRSEFGFFDKIDIFEGSLIDLLSVLD